MPAWQTVIAIAAGILAALQPLVRRHYPLTYPHGYERPPAPPLTPREPDLRAVPYQDR
jgi:hypothetical protein